MMKILDMKSWRSLQEFFSTLNNSVVYLVLRNFEEYVDGNLIDNHPDIDILCSDPSELIKVVGSVSRNHKKKDMIHQQVLIDDKIVSLDIRYVGDGYYDSKWEVEMLRRRMLEGGLCYVMDKTNYFFSLLYHALIQKRKISEDYQERLLRMSKEIGLSSKENVLSIDTLQEFMRNNNYHFTFPEYPGGIVNFKYVDKTMILYSPMRLVNRTIYKIKTNIKKKF